MQLLHTWNTDDASTTNTTQDYDRGVGWYQLEFDHSDDLNANKRLQFDCASIVAKV
ncbi:hypothetical protein [uncultured Acinetobacter sp.]|uniref:hypothetical protein n=1 Tax=uncultured Acinetobacter sp. TaxID=165433 RepID=UPI00258DB2B2|nr:hypothetical protein [uncultured Acinetobacter sp.]